MFACLTTAGLFTGAYYLTSQSANVEDYQNQDSPVDESITEKDHTDPFTTTDKIENDAINNISDITSESSLETIEATVDAGLVTPELELIYDPSTVDYQSYIPGTVIT